MKMRYKFARLIGLIHVLLFIVSLSLYSQCLLTDFTINNSSVCQGEKVSLTNTSSGAEYIWDFCANDMASIPLQSTVATINDFNQTFGIDVVKQGDNWYGFVTNRGANSLLRLNYGSSLENVPSVTNLGNPGGLLNSPEDIDVISINGQWYAVVALNQSAPNNVVILYEFGTDLTSVPSGQSLGNFGLFSVIRGVSVAVDDNNIVLALAQSNFKVTLINFRDSFANTVGTADKIVTDNLLNASTIFSVKIYNKCDQWYVFAASWHRIHQLNFGSDLFRQPISQESYLATDIGSVPFDIDAVTEGEDTYLFIGNLDAAYLLYRFNGLSNAPSLVAHEESSSLTDFSVNYTEGKFILQGVRNSSKTLTKVIYRADCGASIDFSYDFDPNNLSYSKAGTYPIQLTSINGGYNNRVTKEITVTSDIAPDIDFTSQNICLSFPINFSPINTSDNLTSYNWNFGDGSSSTSANPNHTYASAGEYTVTLEVTSSDGCENFTQKDITIYPEPAPAFNLPSGTICTNDTYLFENTTPGNYNGNISYEWFVSGVSVATTEDLSYEFPTGGAKEIKLVATIPGCSVESVQNISNVSVGPVAQFTVNDDCVGKALQFNNTSTGDITSTHWDFGNGFTSNLENPLFQYAAPGTYDVTLTLTNSAGCQTSKVLEVNVYELPDVQFTNDLSCEGTPTAFTDETTVGDANVASWKWNFDDPSSGSNASTDRNPIHTFTTSGAFDVKLVAQTTNGCKDSVQQVVNVKQAPVAGFEYDKLCINEAVQFTDTSDPVPGQTITTWSWDLGGVFSAEQNPETTFQFAIDYNVGLTVTSENLCTSTTYKTVSVKPAPSVTFGLEQACDNAEAHFFDTTDPLGDPITSRSWNFANQAISVDSSTYHAFSQVGNYDVSLTVMTENGCDYSVTESIQINEAPTAAFTPSVTFGAPPLDVEFTNKSVGADSFHWIFEEGNTSDIMDPTYTFTEENSYDVKLVASDENGCNDTTTQRINVLYPDLDIVLTALNRNPSDETEVILTVGNNGTVTIDSFKAAIDLGNQAIIEKIVTQTLNPRVSAGAPVQSVNINLGFNIDPQSLDYLCVTVTPIFEGLEESDLANNTRCINLSDNQTVILAPYPNPASNQLHLQIISNDQNAATVQIFSSRGDLVKSIEIDKLTAGMNNVLINTADLDKGIYMIKASSGGKTAMYKVVVEN